MKRTINIFVSGKVQGVGFRYFTQVQAKKTGVMGTVKNLPDGRVEIVAQAEPAVLDKFVGWCQKGPNTAQVTGVEVLELATSEPFFDRFVILRRG